MSGTVVAISFAGIALLLLLVASAVDRPYQQVELRVERTLRRTRRSNSAEDILADIEAEAESPEDRGLAARREKLMRLVSERLAGEGFGNRLAQRLRRADLRLQVAEFMLLAIGLAAGGLLLGWVMSRVAFGCILAAGGAAAPFIYLNLRLGKRRRTLDGQLGDALALISNSLRSGYSFLQAMDVVAKEMPVPIGKEFEMVLRETRVNIPVEDALQNLVRRVGSDDLDLAVTAMLIQRQVGGNMAEVMDNIAATIRDRAKLAGEVSAITATGRMSGWVVASVPAALIVLVSAINPEFMRPLFTHPIGWAALGVAVLMQLTGVFIISRITNVKF